MQNKFTLNIWTTSKCNFRCTYCYEKAKYGETDLSYETADQIIRFIIENIKKDQFLTVYYHGGEPTLNYDVIKYMVNRIENEIPNEKQFGMTTNCSLLTDEMIDYLCEHFPKGLSLSIDGDKETHELHRKCIQGNITYDFIFSNALKLLKKNSSIRIRMTYTRKTVKRLYQNIRYLIEYGFKIIVPIPDMFSEDWTDQDFTDIENEFKKIKQYLVNNNIIDIYFEELSNEFKPQGICRGGEKSFNIDAQGDIYPCTFVVGDTVHWIGNVFSGLDDKKIMTIACINKNRDKVEGCEECILSKYCSNTRCLLENYAVTGNYYKPNLVKCNMMNIKYNLCNYMNDEVSQTNQIIHNNRR